MTLEFSMFGVVLFMPKACSHATVQTPLRSVLYWCQTRRVRHRRTGLPPCLTRPHRSSTVSDPPGLIRRHASRITPLPVCFPAEGARISAPQSRDHVACLKVHSPLLGRDPGSSQRRLRFVARPGKHNGGVVSARLCPFASRPKAPRSIQRGSSLFGSAEMMTIASASGYSSVRVRSMRAV